MHQPGYGIVRPPAFTFTMAYSHTGPTATVHVRRAIAYVVDRQGMITAAYGTVNPGGQVEQHPSGPEPATAAQFLSKGQIDQLNTYPADKSRATQQLEAAGYHKSGDTWSTRRASR